jgi:isopropylmalate/homocitrate/citramalate synthase
MVEFKDLTLREGSQVPGLEIPETTGKRVLDELATLGVGRVELSFPRADPRVSWYRYAEELGLRTAALARATAGDVDAALGVSPEEIEAIIPGSDVQLEHAIGKSREEAQELLAASVERALDGGVDAGVTLMDAIRGENDYLAASARAAVDRGAKHVTIADTTGAGTPQAVRETVGAVASEIGSEAGIAIHTHDDMDVASANAAAGVLAGARSVDATVGEIGERAGNAPLEAVAVLLAEQEVEPGLELESLVPACRRVHEHLGVEIPPDKPVIGELAYRHESGLHTAAILREPSTYEPFDPADYGGKRQLLFGRGTGRGAARALLAEIGKTNESGEPGEEPTDDAIATALAAIEEAAAEKGEPLSEEEARRLIRSR